MFLHTTPKAKRALHAGLQTLAMRERSLLLLAERRAPATRLRRLFHGMGEQIVSDLLREGYLAPATAPQAQDGAATAAAEPSAEPTDE
ncbi:MAG: hypothetical protein ACYC0T_05355 [Ramlibacter sp.]